MRPGSKRIVIVRYSTRIFTWYNGGGGGGGGGEQQRHTTSSFILKFDTRQQIPPYPHSTTDVGDDVDIYALI